MLSYSDLLKLKRWNTPSVYNGWEVVTRKDRLEVKCNKDETRDFMPQMGSMIGYAATVTFEPSDKSHFENSFEKWCRYREFVASLPFPKIVVLRDLDSPDHILGSFWGEVCANMHKALGCVGTITDGAIRDLDEMTNAGFKAIARRLCVGHAYSVPVEWGLPVNVFGCEVRTGDLVHADKHGFIVIPPEDQPVLEEAVALMDSNECSTVIKAARESAGKPMSRIVGDLRAAGEEFAENAAAIKKRLGLI